MDDKLQAQLKEFWRIQEDSILKTNDFKMHALPLARIKKIMKSDEDVQVHP
jgi:nuclear transcription factor Y gamma